jgi:hypothetical protein
VQNFLPSYKKFLPGYKSFYLVTKVSTRLQKFLPGYKSFYPVTKVSTRLQKFLPGKKLVPVSQPTSGICLQPASPFSRRNPLYSSGKDYVNAGEMRDAGEMCDVSQSSSSGIASVVNGETIVTYFGPDCGGCLGDSQHR